MSEREISFPDGEPIELGEKDSCVILRENGNVAVCFPHTDEEDEPIPLGSLLIIISYIASHPEHFEKFWEKYEELEGRLPEDELS